MEGTVRSFLANKGYGFADGDDGNSYFLHSSDLCEACDLAPGVRIAFEETAAPKGYRARRIRTLAKGQPERYETPSSIAWTSHSEFRDWQVIESVPWVIVGSSKDSMEKARIDLERRAAQLGANAVMLVKYRRETGQEASGAAGRYGSGIHHFSVHHYRGVPAVVGRAVEVGGTPREELLGLPRRIDELASRFAKKNQVRRRLGLAGMVLGLAFLAWAAVRYHNVVGLMLAAGVIAMSQNCYRSRVGTWLESTLSSEPR